MTNNGLTQTRNTGLDTNFRTGLPGWKGVDKKFDQLLNEFFGGPMARSTSPSSRVVEVEDGYEWSVDMPGVGRENIAVEYNDSDQTLEISTSYEGESQRRSYRQSLFVGNKVDVDSITATYEDGVLTVELPKIDSEEVTRQIEIQ